VCPSEGSSGGLGRGLLPEDGKEGGDEDDEDEEKEEKEEEE
jgi:hypothetical protein